MNIKRTTDITSEIGFLMLTHGAEINRVEDTICRIAKAYGFSADVFAIPSSLVVTVSDEENKSFTKTRRVYYRDLNLDRVDRLNNLARTVCADKPDYEYVCTAISEICARPSYSDSLKQAMAALGAGAFALLFGGSMADAVAAAVTGVLVRMAFIFMEKKGGGALLNNIVGGAICSTVAMILTKLYIGLNIDTIIISALMLLVPGLAMTNSMRDIVAGDLVTGVMKGTEAIVVATGIAIGVMMSIAAFRGILGVSI